MSRSHLIAMRDALTHRGPDDAGLWISPGEAHAAVASVGLGHRRLSIIDLSHAGAQPMSNEDGSVWLVFNGEIYNFPELRPQLEALGHRFASHTDSEVIIHAYEEWGAECVRRLRGMFAFAIWDQALQSLLLARDRFGIKPLYYYFDSEILLFGSELKALMAHPSMPRDLDNTAIYDYLTFGYIPAPKTIYKNVNKLSPASMLVRDREGTRIERYWDIDFTPQAASDDTRAVETVQGQLADATRSHLISDVPLGVLLSGGLDSSAVAATLARTLGESIRTFSVGFDIAESSEVEFSRIVAAALGTEHRELTVALGGLDEALEQVVASYDEPFGDGSAIPTRRLCDMVRREVKVVLSGDGGDEVFAGYSRYGRWLQDQKQSAWWRRLPAPVREAVRRSAPTKLQTRKAGRLYLLSPLEQYVRGAGVFTRPEKRLLLSPDFEAQFHDYDELWPVRPHFREDLDPISALQYLDMHTYLPDDILTKVDRASMAVGLEVRVPLLDHELAEHAAALPSNLRWRDGETKWVLRRAIAALLPAEIMARGKQGFSAPWKQWLKPDEVRRRLEQGALVRAGILDKQILETTGTRMLKGGKLWSLLVLEAWMERHF